MEKIVGTRLVVMVMAAAWAAGCSGAAGGTAGLSGPGAALASAWEAPASYRYSGEVSVEKAMDGTDAAVGVGFTWYVKPIEDGDAPFGLQEFYGSEGKVAVSWADLGGAVTADVADNWSVEAEYTLPPMDGAFTLHAGAAGGADVLWSIGADWQAADDLNVALDYSAQGDASDLVLGAEYVLGLSGRWLDVSVELGLSDTGTASGLVIGAGAEYYFSKSLSLGVSVEAADSDLGGDVNYGLGASWWTGPLSVSLEYALNESDPNALAVSVGYRF